METGSTTCYPLVRLRAAPCIFITALLSSFAFVKTCSTHSLGIPGSLPFGRKTAAKFVYPSFYESTNRGGEAQAPEMDKVMFGGRPENTKKKQLI